MSQSQSFANYSNMSRSLQEEALQPQQGKSVSDTINDAANFEQQFLIGMAVHQKAKVGEQVGKYFKGSKKLQDATGLSEDDLGDIATGDFSGISSRIAKATSQKLQDSLTKFKDIKAQNLTDSLNLKSAQTLALDKQAEAERLGKISDQAKQDVETAKSGVTQADSEVTRLAGTNVDNQAALDAAAQDARATADAGVQGGDDLDDLIDSANTLRATATSAKIDADAARKLSNDTSTTTITDNPADMRLKDNPLSESRLKDARNKEGISDTAEADAQSAKAKVDAARQAINNQSQSLDNAAIEAENAATEARTSIPAAQAALGEQQAGAVRAAAEARDTLATKTATAEQAGGDAEAASGEAEAASADVATGLGAAEEGASAEIAAGSKAASVVSKIKEVDAGIEGTSEFDPLGLVIAGIGAIAASIIGRGIKTRDETVSNIPVIASSYASTIGA